MRETVNAATKPKSFKCKARTVMADRRQIVTAFFSAPETLEVESFPHKARTLPCRPTNANGYLEIN